MLEDDSSKALYFLSKGKIETKIIDCLDSEIILEIIEAPNFIFSAMIVGFEMMVESLSDIIIEQIYINELNQILKERLFDELLITLPQYIYHQTLQKYTRNDALSGVIASLLLMSNEQETIKTTTCKVASFSQCARETANRKMIKLQKKGLISYQYRANGGKTKSIIKLDVKGLKRALF